MQSVTRRQFVKRGAIWVSAATLGTRILRAAAPALVQQAVGTDSGGDAVTLFPVNTTAGNSVIFIISHLSIDTMSPGDVTLGPEELIKGPVATVAGVTIEIWYLHNIAGGTKSVEALNDSFSNRISVSATEWSGLTNAAPEATNTNSGVLGSTVTTGSVTPISVANLVIAGGGWTANNYSSGPTNSFTRLTPTGGGAAWQEGAYLIQTTATSKSTGWGLTAGINWAAAIAVFGAPSVASSSHHGKKSIL